MTRHDPFFKEKVVEDYLSSLLTEPKLPDTDIRQNTDATPNEVMDKQADNAKEKKGIRAKFLSEQDIKLAAASELLRKANLVQLSDPINADNSLKTELHHKEIHVEVENNKEAMVRKPELSKLQDRLDKNFQALFFDVAGMTLAVPLVELGGIHQITNISHIIGKPAWFKGVMIKGAETFSCVDSAQWIMPKPIDIDYNYLVMLGKTPWGLMCEALINTQELSQDEVKWRTDTTKRPWLAGMVKEKMCALIDVANFVQMLESGMPRK